MLDKFCKPAPLKRIKNKTFINEVDNDKTEDKYQASQLKEFTVKYKTSQRLVPLFWGTPRGDYRGDNLFLSIADTRFIPTKPKFWDYGHIF